MEAETKKKQGNFLWVVMAGLILLILLFVPIEFLFPAQSYPPTSTSTPPLSPTANLEATAQSDGDLTFAQQLALIDEALRQALTASIAYNAPQAMKLDETITIELLLNPSVAPADLGSQLTEPGQVVTAIIEVTPRMKAELISQEGSVFIIQPLHDSPEQFISSSESTLWNWDVTAKEGGTHRLTLILYRLLTVDGKENWRQIETYRSDIVVSVTLGQRLAMLDWKWAAGFLLTLVGSVIGILSWLSNRNKNIEKEKTTRSSKKKHV